MFKSTSTDGHQDNDKNDGEEENNQSTKINFQERNLLNDDNDEVLWNINDNSIGPLPPFHPPMDRKCVAFIAEIHVNNVADRITNYLRESSIVAMYEGATVHANTSDRVKFRIQLYRASNSEFQNGIIVECVRVRGDVRAFHSYCRSLLTKAKGAPKPTKKPKLNRPFTLARGGGGGGKGSLAKAPPPTLGTDFSSSEQGIEVAWSLLKKDRLDANVLGMESVVNLTNPDIATGDEALLLIAHAVLGVKFNHKENNVSNSASAVTLPTDRSASMSSSSNNITSIEGEEEDERFAEIHNLIISLIRDEKLIASSPYNSKIAPSSSLKFLQGRSISDDEDDENNKGKSFDDSDDEDDEQDMEDIQHISTMRSLALKVLLNSLEIAVQMSPPDSNNTTMSLTRSPNLLQLALNRIVTDENIVPCLLQELSKTFQTQNDSSNAAAAANASNMNHISSMGQNAHDATLAMEILTILAEYSTLVQQYIVRNYINSLQGDLFYNVYNVGRKRHLKLEQAVTKFVTFVEKVLLR